jgi:mono/diheme cytochrome c family protein
MVLLFPEGQDRSAQPFIDSLNQNLVMQRKTIYATQCASCHGTRLEGHLREPGRCP